MRMNELPVDLSRLKAGWMFVGAAFQKPSVYCEDCGYCEHKGQMLPYGEGQAYEMYTECVLGQRVSDRPEQCPAYAAHLQEQAELAESELDDFRAKGLL